MIDPGQELRPTSTPDAKIMIPVLATLILKPKEERDTWPERNIKPRYLPLLAALPVGCRDLTVIDVQGMFKAWTAKSSGTP